MFKSSPGAIILAAAFYLFAFSSIAAAQNANGLSLSDARHLLTRTGLGASPNELNTLIGVSRTEAADIIVSGLGTKPYSTPPAWTKSSAPHHYRFGNFSTAEKQQFRSARLNEIDSLRQWWLREMISTPNPQAERLVLFWHNHFATAYSALDNHSITIARQHMMLRENAAGNFRVMLQNIIHDPAMLNYLDNNNSKKEKPNENLAREIMELFSIGEGSYTESDIKNAARALTGYSFSNTYDMRFIFKPWAHDDTSKTIFGKTGNFNGDDLVDLILEKPEAARFITAKFWRMLISDIETTDTRLTEPATAFRNSDYDIKTLYKSLLLSDAFWDTRNRASLVKSPVSLTVGAIRSTGILPVSWQTLALQQRQMGQHLFEPPNVAGWPGGAAWITPGRLLTRLEWLGQLEASSGSATPQKTMSTSPSMNPEPSIDNMAETSQTESNMMTAAPPVTMMSEQQELSIRMAAEEFDEHVKYRVKVFGMNNAVWDSGVLELTGGHDTKRMGRVERRNLPWQSVNFPIPIADKNVTAIEVSFINDGSTPDGADRNLYISRAVHGNRVWLPSDGKQTGKCARKKPGQQGSIYCPGTLRMEKSQTHSTSTIDPPQADTLRVSGVNLSFVRPANKKPQTEMVFTLSDVEFDDRFWDTLNVRYIQDKAGYAIRLGNTGCWPECVTEWPECTLQDKYGHKTLSLQLSKNKQHCMYKELQETDKRFARALWMILDDVYAIAKDDPKLQRPNIARNYQQWDKHVTKMVASLPTSAFYDETIEIEIVPRPLIDVTLGEAVVTPIPTGRTESQRSEDLNHLLQSHAAADLTTLLMPTLPAGDLSKITPPLTEILTDLSFQLK